MSDLSSSFERGIALDGHLGVCQQAGTAPLGKPEPATPSRPSGRVSTDAEIRAAGRFLVDRLEEFESELLDDEVATQFHGHVVPALARFRDALDTQHRNTERAVIARCIAIAREVRDGFLSEQYAVGQPIASLCERFACDQVAAAIEQEFAMGGR